MRAQVSESASSDLGSVGSPSVRQVRLNRIVVKDGGCVVEIDGKQFSVANYSAFGLAIQVQNPRDLKDEYRDVPLFLEGTLIDRLALNRVRDEATEGGYTVAFEILGEPLKLAKMMAIDRAHLVIREHATALARDETVPDTFRDLVYRIKDSLEHIESLVNGLRKGQDLTSAEDVLAFENTVTDVISGHMNALLAPTFESLARTLKSAQPKSAKIAYEFFREQLKHLIYQSPLSERAFRKPLGYPGDFEMMNFIYRAEDHGESLFGKCLHQYFVRHPNAQAVRNRADYLKAQIRDVLARHKTKEPLQILSVACGPALEVQMLLKEGIDRNKIEIHLLDQDLSALQHAQLQLRTTGKRIGNGPQIHYIHKTIKEVIIGGLSRNYDFIYSAGLFDYFSDPVARLAAAKLLSHVSPGGQLVIGNFAASPGHQGLMELAFDWNLIYRTEQDLRRLYRDLGENVRVDHEPERINLFFVISK